MTVGGGGGGGGVSAPVALPSLQALMYYLSMYQVCAHSSLLKIKPVMNQFETVMFLLPLLVVNKCLIILALTYTLLEHLLTF